MVSKARKKKREKEAFDALEKGNFEKFNKITKGMEARKKIKDKKLMKKGSEFLAKRRKLKKELEKIREESPKVPKNAEEQKKMSGREAREKEGDEKKRNREMREKVEEKLEEKKIEPQIEKRYGKGSFNTYKDAYVRNYAKFREKGASESLAGISAHEEAKKILDRKAKKDK